MISSGKYKHWLQSAIIYFFVASILGVILRFAFVIELPECIRYKNVQHAHSHVAMMGWLTAAFYLCICYFFKLERILYSRLFWILQASVLGMLISFPIQGYGSFSILFSSLHMIVLYVFAYAVWKDLKKDSKSSGRLPERFLKTALFFMILSTMGVWAMGPIMASSLRGSALYYAAVQFFLHFQFNGWFIFVLLAIMFKVFEDNDIRIESQQLKYFYWLLFTSCCLTFALAVTWSTPDQILFWINSIGVLLQLIALFYFVRILQGIVGSTKLIFEKWHFILWGIAFFCLGFKMLIQTFVAIPYLATISYTIRNFIIGFIHLLMLGALSTFIFGIMSYFRIRINQFGIFVFLTGLLLTELLLFGQGFLIWTGFGFIPHYHLVIALLSLLFPISIGIILASFRGKRTEVFEA